jgi:hypothetical protein
MPWRWLRRCSCSRLCRLVCVSYARCGTGLCWNGCAPAYMLRGPVERQYQDEVHSGPRATVSRPRLLCPTVWAIRLIQQVELRRKARSTGNASASAICFNPFCYKQPNWGNPEHFFSPESCLAEPTIGNFWNPSMLREEGIKKEKGSSFGLFSSK